MQAAYVVITNEAILQKYRKQPPAAASYTLNCNQGFV